MTALGSDQFPIWDVAAMRILLDAFKPRRVVEVGSWIGLGSTQAFLERGDIELWCVDTWRGSPGVEKHRVDFDPFSEFVRNAPGAKIVRASSAEAAAVFADGSFDMAFVDADHCYEEIKRDVALWWPKVRSGGVFVGHDGDDRVPDENARAAFATTPGEVMWWFDPPRMLHHGVALVIDEIGGVEMFIERAGTADHPDKRSSVWWKAKP